MSKIRWAILGTGAIANRFAQSMQVVEDAQLAAVVSRTEERAQAFAAQYGGEAVCTDYGAMLAEITPDVVYIATPNDLHYDAIMQALDAGVNVLCEKPMVDTVWQLNAAYAKAAERGLFVMEAMWTRCFPAVRKVREWIASGRIGEPLTVNVSFNFKSGEGWQSWKTGLAHAGGALRDIGIYSIAVANMVFPGAPRQMASTMHSNGEVDDAFHIFLDYGDGRTAFAGGAFNQMADTTARISGSEGTIAFGPEFWRPTEAILQRYDGQTERINVPFASEGFQYEIEAVHDALRTGRIECPDFTHEESRVIAQIIESARKAQGIYYAADGAGE